MKKTILTLATTLTLMFPIIVLADGNDLLEKCLIAEKSLNTHDANSTDLDSLEIGYCFGIVQGVRGTMQLQCADECTTQITACFPENESIQQSVRVVTSFLRKSPTILYMNEIDLIIVAFMNAYPCNDVVKPKPKNALRW